jgi:hypothetical protein
VKAKPSTPSAATRSGPAASPHTRLSTPAGSPAAIAASIKSEPVSPAPGEGLNTAVLPATRQAPSMLHGSATAKLNGAMTANTPTGRSRHTVSSCGTARRICWVKPSLRSISSAYQATRSTASSASPMASSRDLPTSNIDAMPRSYLRLSISSAQRRISATRSCHGRLDHAGNAARAAATASPTALSSAATSRATSKSRSIGLRTS